MPAPAGSPHLPVLVSATALCLLSPLELIAAVTSDEIKQAIHTGLPRYDPAAYEKAQAERAARSTPKHAPAHVPETKPEPPAVPAPSASAVNILQLPTLTVHADLDPPKPLPRLTTPTPIDNEPGELFESPGARDKRLIKNHLSKLDRILNRYAWFGSSLIARARQAEAAKEKTRLMDRLALVIEMQAALGLDPKEVKQLRTEYLKLHYSGPK